MRLYQSRHPEVEIVWDTAYDTVSDYSAHWEQYAEQLSLRLMSGDVGDIVLLNGSGLEVSAVLESDAMADLTPYLEQCPYRDELDEELLQPLTNSAGRLCGVPLGVSPQYLIYNETLGQSLGLTWDTDALTWKDLLDLATVWQAAGEASPSLFCTGTARDPDFDFGGLSPGQSGQLFRCGCGCRTGAAACGASSAVGRRHPDACRYGRPLLERRLF